MISSGTGSTASTRAVVDATGAEVQVPVEPKKIVALSEQDLDGLLALGVKPSGTVNGRGQTTRPAYLGDLAAGITVVGTVAEPALDAIADHEGESVSIIRWNPDGPVVMLKDSFASLVIRDAGLVRPATQQEPGFAHTDVLSLENLDKPDGDWIFAATLVEVDGTLWTFRGGPLGALKVLEDLTANPGD